MPASGTKVCMYVYFYVSNVNKETYILDALNLCTYHIVCKKCGDQEMKPNLIRIVFE